MINTHPTKCNICGGRVIYTSNSRIYGREYGSGYCYLCQSCGAYVGTHKPRPREAFGILADERMRNGKKMCHSLFDPLWQGKPKAQKNGKTCMHGLLDRWAFRSMNATSDISILPNCCKPIKF